MEESEKLNFLSTLLPVSVILFIIVLGVLRLNQQFNKKLYNQKLESEKLKLQHQKELLRSSIHTQENERKLIARNLHDELGAVLSIARMHLMQLEKKLEENANHSYLPDTENIRQLTETALQSMRQISHNLLPPQLETFGLTATLEDTAEQINQIPGMEMKLTFPPNLPRFNPETELGLYRIFMELTNNTLKHAAASEITVCLELTPEHFKMHFADNGIGMTGNEPTSGLGHKSIDARAHALDGRFFLLNNTNQGLEAVIELQITNFEQV